MNAYEDAMPIDRDKLLWLYETMATIRSFEMRGFHEVASRAISAAIHRSVGQEAVPTVIQCIANVLDSSGEMKSFDEPARSRDRIDRSVAGD